MYTCDGGRTWEGYKTLSGNQRCGDEGINCSHNEYSPKGIAYGAKGFVATFGWGKPGSVVRTLDGDNFDVVYQDSSWAGLAFGNGKYVLHGGAAAISSDLIEWVRGEKYRYREGVKNARMISFVPHRGGYFISMGNSGPGDLMISRNDGMTYGYPETLPMECANTGEVVFNKNTALIKTEAALCYSLDGGANWIVSDQLVGVGKGTLLYNGSEFRLYINSNFYSSPDGLKWSEMQTGNPVGIPRLPGMKLVTYHPDQKSYVAFSKEEYEKSKFNFSDDGINWQQAEPGNVPVAPHKFQYTAVGYLQACAK